MQPMKQENATVWTPPAAERRLADVLHDYWHFRKGNQRFPSLDDDFSDALGEFWQSCFILDVRGTGELPYFHYLGPQLAKLSGVFLGGANDWQTTLLDQAVAPRRHILITRKPEQRAQELTRYDGTLILYSSIMLPLSDDQQTINFLFGGASAKIIAPD